VILLYVYSNIEIQCHKGPRQQCSFRKEQMKIPLVMNSCLQLTDDHQNIVISSDPFNIFF